ncbi:dCTP deaminase [Erythrobacter sp.]|uniref:dCTP deaminase n=1 Tax=Erythrobacter sp. TaxID=1042 RepID=UPI003C73E07F
MILSGPEIRAGIDRGDIVVEPYHQRCIEPNSYGIHLGNTILTYKDTVLDIHHPLDTVTYKIPDQGFILQPDQFYLAATKERIGSTVFAAELYATCSAATSGIFIQLSAPLGHCGAIVNWTLEIVVAHSIIVYPGMPIGKVCFWKNEGQLQTYLGRYEGDRSVTSSRVILDAR